MPSASRGQNKALNLLELDLQMVLSRGCWEPHPGPLQQPVLFTAEPPLHPQTVI